MNMNINENPNVNAEKVWFSLIIWGFFQAQETLFVTVHEAKGLPGGDLPDPPDPYVKMYLLPDRSKKSKRKSDAKKDTVTPVYDENFQYEIASSKLHSEELEVSVVDRKGIFSRRSTMGRVVVGMYWVIALYIFGRLKKRRSISLSFFGGLG